MVAKCMLFHIKMFNIDIYSNEKKYEITEKTIEWNGRILHQIKALKDFGNVKTGRLGGWIEKESNLSQEGDCWVFNDAIVCDDAKVYEGALIYNNAQVRDHAEVFWKSVIKGNACIYDNAKVFGNVVIKDRVEVWGNAVIYEYARLYGNVIVYNNAQVYDHAAIYSNARISGYAQVGGNTIVFDDAQVCGYTKIYEDAEIYGDVKVFGNAEIRGNARVNSNSNYAVLQNFCGNCRFMTWTQSNDMWCVDCFYGTGKELIEKAYRLGKKYGEKCETMIKAVEVINSI